MTGGVQTPNIQTLFPLATQSVSYITYQLFSKKCFLLNFIFSEFFLQGDFLTIRVLTIVKNLHTNLVANVSTIPTTTVWHINYSSNGVQEKKRERKKIKGEKKGEKLLQVPFPFATRKLS
jgi:hypothetical protein